MKTIDGPTATTCLGAIADLAAARLRDDRVADENVLHDLREILRLANEALDAIGAP